MYVYDPLSWLTHTVPIYIRDYVLLPSACMCSEGTVVGLSVLKLACSKFIPSTMYLTHKKGVKFCGISS